MEPAPPHTLAAGAPHCAFRVRHVLLGFGDVPLVGALRPGGDEGEPADPPS
jgi:hypothetical protein